MSLLIETPREIETALAAKAARLGVPVERYALGVLRRDVESNGGSTVESPRIGKGGALLGKYAHLNVSSEGVHRMRREEVERDEAKYAARHGGFAGKGGGA